MSSDGDDPWDDSWTDWDYQLQVLSNKASRWNSSNIGVVHTDDQIGDSLVMLLRETARSQSENDQREERGESDIDSAAATRPYWYERVIGVSKPLREQLRSYEEEPNLLLKLADTGRVVKILKRALQTTIDLLNISDRSFVDKFWKTFEHEREARSELYSSMSEDNFESLVDGLSDEEQQLRVLTLLKHDFKENGGVLLPQEIDVVSTVFDQVARHFDVVVGFIPEWFATSEDKWFLSTKSALEGREERCLRQVAAWWKLQHPHVRRLFGACHVGDPFVVHQHSWELYITERDEVWQIFHDYALGLQFVHDRGMAHQNLSMTTLVELRLRTRSRGGVEITKGVLSGLGLVSLQESVGHMYSASMTSDVLAFSLAMLSILFHVRGTDNWYYRDLSTDNLVAKLPRAKPDFITKDEWSLLCAMCAAKPSERMSMDDVVNETKTLADAQLKSEANTCVLVDPKEVASYVFPLASFTIEEMLQQIHDQCDDDEMNWLVYDRLKDLGEQIKGIHDLLSNILLDDYCSILWESLKRLERRMSDGFSETAKVCASRTLANQNYGVHYNIDHLILKHQELSSQDFAHKWKNKLKQVEQEQRARLETCLESPMEFLSGFATEQERSEAVALVEYETKQSLVSGGSSLPAWFIPPYQVELLEHIDDGAFGRVYYARWLGADVVVKQVTTDQSDPTNQEQFRREVDLWFSLNHRGLIKLYGACHVGQPFFVCERASEGTLVSYLKNNDSSKWGEFWSVATALAHLHERGIVHGDLKGNNILVDVNRDAKLADFGLSFLSRNADDSPRVGNGALRWKAPEVLLGKSPSFASDIYSFGMCIIEAVTGEYPWGKTIPDEVVVHKVAMQKLLPPRPKQFNNLAWDLIERMCCFDPDARMSIAAVAQVLNRSFHFEWHHDDDFTGEQELE